MDEIIDERSGARDDEDESVLGALTRRGRLIEAAIKTWKNQLVDLSARNNLLYYRTLKVGTLDLSGQEAFVDQVLDGRTVRVVDVRYCSAEAAVRQARAGDSCEG